MHQVGGGSVDRLRRLVDSPSILLLPTAHDPLSAWLSEMSGFEAVMVSRDALGLSVLANDDGAGVDDELLVSRTAEICRLVSVPVVVDLSPAPTNSLRLRRTVAGLAMCGVAGVVVDDGDGEPRTLTGVEEFQDRLRGVTEGLELRGLDLVVIARTGAMVHGDATALAAVSRLLALQPPPDLGVIEGLPDAGGVQWGDEGSLPLMYLDTKQVGDDSSAREAEKAGFRVLVWSRPLIDTARDAMRESLTALHTHGDDEET